MPRENPLPSALFLTKTPLDDSLGYVILFVQIKKLPGRELEDILINKKKAFPHWEQRDQFSVNSAPRWQRDHFLVSIKPGFWDSKANTRPFIVEIPSRQRLSRHSPTSTGQASHLPRPSFQASERWYSKTLIDVSEKNKSLWADASSHDFLFHCTRRCGFTWTPRILSVSLWSLIFLFTVELWSQAWLTQN